MANRYWVGGTGTWNTSSTTNWSTSSGGSGGASVPTASDSVFFDQVATYTVTLTGALTCLDFNGTAGNVTFTSTGSLTISGSCVYSAGLWSATGAITFNATTTGKTISANFGTSAPIIFNGSGGGWTLSSNLSAPNSTVTLTNGSLSLSSYSLLCLIFKTGAGVKTLDFGTGRISLVNSTSSTTIWDTKTNLTSTTITGTPNVYSSTGGSGSYTLAVGVLTEATAISFELAGSGTFSFNANDTVKNLKFSGGSGVTLANVALTVYGDVTNNSGATFTAGASAWTFAATSGTQTISGSGSNAYDFPFTFNGSSSTTYSLGYNVTVGVTRTTTLTLGTLSLNSYTFSTGVFLTGAGTKAINFGTGQITVTHNLGTTITVWDTATNIAGTTFSGTSNVVVNTSGAGIKTINTGAISEASALNFTITASAGFPIFTAGNTVKNLTLNGTFTLNNAAITIYGNITVTTVTALATSNNAWTFGATSGTQTLSNPWGSAWTFPLNFNGVGGTFQLQSAITTSNATAGAITLTNGTLDLNGYTLTSSASGTATFLTATGTKNLTFNGGSLVINSSGTTAFNNAVPTGFTTTAGTGVGSISLASASAKTFVGGGSTFACTLNNGGAGALTITGANTFDNITSTYAAATAANTITFPASTTTTVNSFTGTGASGRLFTLNSSTAGTQATVALAGGGSVTTPDYLSVKDLAFTPFTTDGTAPYKWNGGANSTNGGNVTGILLAASTVIAYALASGTSFTTPADWNNSNNTIHIFGAGGGGAGGLAASGTSHTSGSGGGGGGYTKLTNQTISGAIAYAIGSAGTAGAAAGGIGGAGGTTTWNTTNTALGGGGGIAGSSGAGAGGTGSTFNGGAGGAGATNSAASALSGASGGGAGGPNGTGGAGSGGNSSGGGGGGGNGGGTAGTANGGAGGNNSAGAGGGTAGGGTGTRGGGGGGGNSTTTGGGLGGVGIDVLNSIGGGGGTGASYQNTAAKTATAYGAGGAGGGTSIGIATGVAGGAGGPGLIVVVYTPGSGPVANTASFFFMY
jgi:hypothetical protein